MESDTHRGVLPAWVNHSMGLSYRQRQQLYISVFLKLGKFLVSISLLQTHSKNTGTTVLAHPHTLMSFSWGKKGVTVT